MGWGFYMIHGSLQIFSSELSEEARASAMSLHAFCFFMGQTVGPIAYGFGLLHLGKMPTLLPPPPSCWCSALPARDG